MSGGAGGFEPIRERLEAAGHQVLAWSAPGYDGTPSIQPYSLAALAAALAADLARRGWRRPVLAGHSMGGMLALECAATWDEPPAALFLACTVPAFRLEGAAREAFLARRLAGIDGPEGMARSARTLIPAMAAPEADPACLAAAVAVMAAIPAATYRLAVTALADFDRQADLPHIPLPALCLAGSADTVARPAAMAAMARRLPRGQFTEVAGAGHLLPLERPEVFAEILLEFVAGLARTG